MTAPKCSHQPRPDTCRTPAGEPADLQNSDHYPVEGVCMLCERPIRSEQFIIKHLPAWKVVKRQSP